MRPNWMSLWSESSRKTEILQVFRRFRVIGDRLGAAQRIVDCPFPPRHGRVHLAQVSFRAADGNVWTESVYEGDYCNV